ncbi:DNA polymerase III subunit alpha [Candidatus Enterovibrio altilux]|uniref:DNA polymerase III subunit alpha n=1 Tax=Candidatus Enterovibrio altilux TaxID=1927128 RepID=A0A291BAF8_9GAMM|nr:DNA polymerase III subunit alpha [Candidatus Enterovibrio luxaltus]ATF09973.1 DNA polymerase III alpha subunit [Candidatus Enterovibrio luxaltus]
MSDPQYIHLRVHSDYSMIDGLSKVPSLVKKVADFGMPAMALTDFTNLCGLVKFYKTAQNFGVKPIIGADFKMQSDVFGDDLCQLTVLAANNIGYKNLTLLISKAYLRGHIQHQPVIDQVWLKELKDGLIILSGGRRGDLGKALLQKNVTLAKQCVSFYQTHFPDAYYIELMRTGRPNEEVYLHFALNFSLNNNLPVVATNEVCFISPDQFDAHEIRVAIHDGYTLIDPRRPKNYSSQQYLRTEEEMCELFQDIPAALTNAVEVAKRCNVTLRLNEYFLPNFPTEGLEIGEFLVKKSKEGLEDRLALLFPDPVVRARHQPEYDYRLKTELEIVNQMGFPGYFLIVMEFIQWSKDNDIPVGPGRGSGAGSLVAYALKITDLDPLKFGLLFERFLNSERVSMPDFDIDFCMDKRDKVIDHVAELYGRDAVSQIITFGTMAAKAVIRDVGRVLGHPYGLIDRISKLVPPDPGITLAKALNIEPQLGQSYKTDEDVRELIDMCCILEGCTRNAGKHAGGVVISPTTITDFAPLYCDSEGHFPVTQFDKNDVETVGLVKFDFLGLRTLTIIDWALKMINPRLQAKGVEPIRIETIPIDDQASFKMLQDSETTAVFQLESRGMKDLIKRLQPDCFEDMIALVALFRPGPLQSGMVDNFIARKRGREVVSYPDEKWQHNSLKKILEPTYGIILYQEQVMQIAQVLSGYTLGGADMLRRAMSKKNFKEMAKQRATFEDGAVKNGINSELAMKIFDLVEHFAGYGFNKSHSAAYALVSYQTLWLKTHYPAEFMAAVMTADMDNTDKIVGLVEECRRMKLILLSPDVNAGSYHFKVNKKSGIVYGIGAIKGIGETPIDNIIKTRNKGGYFKNLFDFCARIDTKKVNKSIIKKLIQSGAMDRLGPHRAAMIASLNDAIKSANQHHHAEAFGQVDMFGILTNAPEEIEHKYANIPPWSDKVWLEGERETLGLYLTGHPIDSYVKELKHYTTWRLEDAHATKRNIVSTVAGLVIAARIITTKRSTRIGILTLDDRSGRIEVILFSDILEKYLNFVEKDRILVVSGSVSFDEFNGGLKISAHEVLDLAQARKKYLRSLAISVTERQIDNKFFERLSEILKPHRAGTIPVNLYYKRNNAYAKLVLGTEWHVVPDDKLIEDLKILLGEKQVELEFD